MRDEQPRLRLLPFATHVTRGLVREKKMRRALMLLALVLAALMIVAGVTVLADYIAPHQHRYRALTYWLACGWITLTALLLALFDLVAVRREGG
jgi:drug/metabolite transporter (DMT)-like permease